MNHSSTVAQDNSESLWKVVVVVPDSISNGSTVIVVIGENCSERV